MGPQIEASLGVLAYSLIHVVLSMALAGLFLISLGFVMFFSIKVGRWIWVRVVEASRESRRDILANKIFKDEPDKQPQEAKDIVVGMNGRKLREAKTN